MTTIYERAGPGQQSSKLGDQELSDLLVKVRCNHESRPARWRDLTSVVFLQAALNDPKIVAKGFDSSRVRMHVADSQFCARVARELTPLPPSLQVFALVSVLLSSPSSPRKSLVKTMNTVYQFDITSDDSSSAGSTRTWYADMRKKGVVGLVKEGEKIPLKPDVTIRCSDRDFVSMATGKVSPVLGMGSLSC